MDATLRKISQMLESDNSDLKRSAIRVLTGLNTKEKEIVKKFSEHLKNDQDQFSRALILEYASKHPSKEFLGALIESLKEASANREKVIGALQAYGESALTTLIQHYQKADEYLRRLILNVIAGVRHAKAYEFVLESMQKNRSIDHLKFVCYLLKSVIEKLDKKERSVFHKCLVTFYKNNKKDKMLTNSALILFGFFKDPADELILVNALDSAKHDFHQKKHALNALLSLGLSGKGHDALIEAVFAHLSDHDFQNIVRPAIAILEKIEITKKFQAKLQQLIESHHPSVRGFALQKVSAFDSSENVDMLIKHLESSDFRVKQAAQVSLEKSTKAVPKLLKLFELAGNFERAEQLTQILKCQKGQFRAPLLKRYYMKLEQLLRKGDSSYRNYLFFLRSVNQEFLYVQVMKKYKSLKLKRKWLDALNCLNLLESVTAQNYDLRLESALCKIMAEKIEYSNVSRDRHEGLLTLQGIAKSQSAIDLAKKILADKKIGDEHKFLIGFHFSEKQQTLRDFGIQMLKSLSKKSGKISKMASKKLEAVKSSNPQTHTFLTT